MTGPPAPAAPEVEVLREAVTMALYVAIVLLAELVVLSDTTSTAGAAARIWGTTIGLALAHSFAFQLSTRLIRRGGSEPFDARLAAAQILGAAVVAAVASIALLPLFGDDPLPVVRTVLAGSIALVGYAVARTAGGGRVRSLLFAAAVLAVATVVVLIKNLLLAH